MSTGAERQDLPPRAIPPDALDRPEAGAQVIRGGVIRGASYFLTILLTGAVVPLMTRHLGVVDFGRFVTASSIVMIVAGVTEFGLSGVATREYALATPGDRVRLLANVLALRTLLTVLGLVVASGFMLLAGYPGVVFAGMLVVGGGLILLNTQQTYTIALTAQLNWGAAAIFDLINAVVVAGGTLALVLIGARLFPFFIVSAASSAAALFAAAVYLRGRVSLRPQVDRALWRRLLHDTLPYAAAVTVGILYPRVGLVVVSVISSGLQTGYYSTAYKIVEVLGGTAGLIASSAFPIFARAGRDDHERLRYATGRVSDTALVAGAYVVLSLVVAAPFAATILGHGFGPSVPVLRLQAIALLAGFAASTWSYTLLALRMHGDLLRVTLGSLLLAIALSIALVPSLGARGAALASVIAEFAVALGYLTMLTRRHAYLRPSFAAVPRVALAAGAAASVELLDLSSFVKWIIASVVYLLLIIALRALPEEIMNVLLRRVATQPTPPASE